MGKIKKIIENELVGGTQTTDIYPVTSVKAVYDENNERLDNILNRRGVVNISTNYNADHIAEVLTLEQAIAKVPSKDRVLGFQGKFLSENGWKSYVFIGDSIADWTNKTKWNNYLTGTDIVQESGEAEDKVMSQKVVSDKLRDLSNHIGASIENSMSGKYDSISIDGNTLTIKKEGFSLFVLGKRIVFEGTEDKVFTGTGIRTSLYLNPYYLINNTSVNFTENDDVFIVKQDTIVYRALLFAEWYQSKLMHTGLIAVFKSLSDTNKQISDTNKQISDINKIQIYCSDGRVPYIEEDRTNDKVYGYLVGNICVRAYGGGRTIRQE